MAYRYNLAEVLTIMGYTPYVDFVVADYLDGGSPTSNNPQIVEWNAGSPKPTEQEVEDAWTSYLDSSELLNSLKLDAKYEIDSTAENVRAKYITSHPGQIGVYNEKYLDAKAYVDAGYPSISGSVYPFVQGEAAAMGATLQEAADLIVATREAWIALAAQIEEERRRGKINVDSATSKTEIDNAKQTTLDNLTVI